MKPKQIISLIAGAALLLSLSACGKTPDTDATVSPTAAASESTAVTGDDTAFVFSDDGITVTEGSSSSGYECDGTALTINGSGTYLLSGTCADGSVKVKKGTTGVKLVLNGLTLTSSDTAPIACNKSTEVTIVAAAGTENTLTDAAANNDDTNPANENAENAVIKCKDGSNVTLCGTGTLTLNANGKNGIKSGTTTTEEGEASLTLRELTLNINAAVNDAVNAEQYLAVESGTLNLAAEDDALHCDLTMDIGTEGADGPTVVITEAYEGIEAATLNIRSGNISILCEDDCLNAANSDLGNYDFSMNIYGGTIVAYTTAGDGFDSNGSLTISGGNITVWSANTADNQPLDADGTISITGGTVLAAGGSNGMGMNLSTTQAYVTFGSDGIGGMGNMGGGPDSFAGGMQPPQSDNTNGQQPPQAGTDGQQPSRPDGSGQDRTPPELPDGSGQNGTPPDLPDGTQPQQPNGNGFGNTLISSGGTVTVSDASGNTVYVGEAPCNASFLFFCSADLTADSDYTLSADGSETTATASVGTTTSQLADGRL